MLARITTGNLALVPFKSGTRNSGLFGRVGRALGSALNAATEARRRRAALNELNQLSDRELADIGLTRADVPLVCAASCADLQKAKRFAPNWLG
jgi:uncharacterized protein YjiS (DUF1127 family)